MVDSYFDGEFNLIKTENGYWQITPLPSEEDLDAHYSLNYYQNPHGTYQSNYSNEELTHIRLKNRILIDLLGDITKSQSVLDVGCGEGFLLKQIYDNSECKVYGLDYSDYGIIKHNPGLKEFFKKGNIYESIDFLIENQICFDFIILKNVLEHVRDPENLISKLKKILVLGGKLVVTVPNDFSWLQLNLKMTRRIDKDYWIAPPEHLNYFTIDSLTKVIESMGLVCEDTISDFPIEWFNVNTHSNYIQSSKRGPEAHKSRLLLENHINSSDIKLATNFWKALAQLRMGRAVTLISSKMV